MPATIADFVKAAEDSGILTAGSLEDFLRGVEPGSDASPLAERLVAAGRLTSFQASSLCDGCASSLVLGPYVVLDLLGRGGMGVVYKAEHRTMRRIVALKVLAPKTLRNPAAVRRFAREVQATARLDHPNIVTAFDAGEVAGLHYLVMQYVDGRNLAEVVREAGPQPVERVVEWVIQAARGLAFAHEQGVIHRDIKPGNLLVDSRGVVKILDMGLATLDTLDADRDQLTATGQVMGTVDYMAPEQARDTRHADARSDIYSLGVTLWYLLTGRLLFPGETVVNRMMAHIHAPPPTLGSACGPLPPRLEAVFQRMVAKDPADRFQSMQDVIASLERIRCPTSRPMSKPSPVHLALALGAVGVLLLVGFLVVPRPRHHDQASMAHADASASGVADRSSSRAASENGASVEPDSTPLMRPTPAAAPFDATQARGHQNAWAKYLGIEVETTNSIGQTLVVIPPGTFTMGEGPGSVDVTLTKPFLLGQTEVTQGQWREVMGTEPWRGWPNSIDGDDVAASPVSWDEAVAFCMALTERERSTGSIGGEQAYRLPTETEWEYACRAGTGTAFSFGNDASMVEDYAWFGAGWGIPGGNTASERFVHAVAGKQPNPWKLYDMHGNVWEWVSEWRSGYTAHSVNGRAPVEHDQCLRGGAWYDPPGNLRSAVRLWGARDAQSNVLGFRVARSLPGAKPTEAAMFAVGAFTAPSTAPPAAICPFDAARARGHQEAWAKHLGIDVETTNSIGQTLVVIPPGTFTMGEGSSTVDVTLTEPFLLGQTEVTQGQWREVMGTEPCRGKRYVIDHDDAAVTYVTWHDAVTFCDRLTERERASGFIRATQAYRLPTRSAWESACRAGTIGTFSCGDDEHLLDRYAWFGGGWDALAQHPIPGGNTADAHYAHPVRLKQANAWGLFDMHGNVFEWVDDRDDAEAARIGPQAFPIDAHAVCRGGSWLGGLPECHSGFWKHFRASDVSGDLGFRVVLTLDGVGLESP